MKTALFQDFTIRRPTVDDAQATVDLMIACDVAEYGESDSSLEDLLYEWDQLNLNRDAWLVFTKDNRLVGYAAVFENTDINFDIYVDPKHKNGKLCDYLLQRCEERASAQLAAGGKILGAVATIIISQANAATRQVLEASDYQPRKYYFRMESTMAAMPTAPVWPENCTLRTMVAGQDDQAVYDFIQIAFDRPERIPPAYADWRAYMKRPDHFEPDLWFLLFCEDDLIGAALCYDYGDYGWVRQLGVSPAWRKQGLGAGLLQHAFGVFYQRGHRKVALGVDSERPNAYSLYENVGMACVRRFDEYYKLLD